MNKVEFVKWDICNVSSEQRHTPLFINLSCMHSILRKYGCITPTHTLSQSHARTYITDAVNSDV